MAKFTIHLPEHGHAHVVTGVITHRPFLSFFRKRNQREREQRKGYVVSLYAASGIAVKYYLQKDYSGEWRYQDRGKFRRPADEEMAAAIKSAIDGTEKNV